MSKPKFRVAICGAGIGGLALAVTIGKYSTCLPVDLYEAGPEITTIGAGIVVWKRSQEAFRLLGLEADLMKNALLPPKAGQAAKDGSVPGMRFKRADQPDEGHHFFTHTVRRALTLHRASVVDIFKHTAESGAITLHFEDGTSAETDVLIGADGIRSATRASLFQAKAEGGGIADYQTYIQPTWSGTVAYRCVVSAEKVSASNPDHPVLANSMNYCGKSKHIIAYPIAQGRLINIVAFYTTENGEGTVFPDKGVLDVPSQAVQDCYSGWEPEVRDLLKCVDKASRWAIHVVDPLPVWVSGRVALLGDAAHAMSTHFALGVGLAVEDAYTLGRILTDDRTHLGNIAEAFKVYDETRRPLATTIARESRLTGLLYEFVAPGYYDGADRSREAEELEELKRDIEKGWSWEWDCGFADDWERSRGRLEDVLGQMA